MNKTTFLLSSLAILTSCSNETEEITNPETGQLELRYEYYLDDDGQKVKDGELVEWYLDGSKRLVQNYEDGVLQGQSIFYKNKDTIAYNNYVDGERHGECLMKNSQGITFSVINYKDGILDGKQEYFYHSGKRKCIGYFHSGSPHGEWSYYDEKGNDIGTFNNNGGFPSELTGTWTIDDKDNRFYIFDKNGAFSFYAPLFKYSVEPSEIITGMVYVGQKIQLLYNNGREYESFEIISLKEDEIILRNLESNLEKWVLVDQ